MILHTINGTKWKLDVLCYYTISWLYSNVNKYMHVYTYKHVYIYNYIYEHAVPSQ